MILLDQEEELVKLKDPVSSKPEYNMIMTGI